jgi:hypothetical protein
MATADPADYVPDREQLVDCGLIVPATMGEHSRRQRVRTAPA